MNQEEAAAGVLQQAIGTLREILSSPQVVTNLSASLETQRNVSNINTGNRSATETEIRELFRPTPPTSRAFTPCTTTGGMRQSLRYETQRHFGNWGPRPRKRAKTHYHDTFNKDVILLPRPGSCTVVKHRAKQKLYDKGHVINGFEFQKTWDLKTVIEKIREAFGGKLSPEVELELLMACGSRLVTPKLEAGQDLDAILIHKIYKSKALYVRPSKPIVEDETGCSSEDDKDTESTFSPRDLRSSSQGQPSNPTWDSFSSLAAASTQSAPAPSDVPSQHSVSLPASCLSNAQLSTSSSEGTSGLSANYNSYLTVVAALSDASSDDEELNKAILASLQTESCPPTCSVPVKDLLQDLAKQINHLKNSKFNINRNTVLDGAIRGFKRGTYDPCNTMSVRFSDDMGVHEEAVDLGGPRREFLRLLIEALPNLKCLKDKTVE
ncbi:hypothetical protein OJAV_G00191430 [Oryzias javanicus]|uniref:HECT domain-containing protein n=1 Tax=Oryzias javanicus TaxID=123683 RepID=A0A437CAF8_ORYJA|nr:hypothetical protein OJAV_G00191430 [Oryzias javanicus]